MEKSKKVLITGAGSVGVALGQKLSGQGARLIFFDSCKDKLDAALVKLPEAKAIQVGDLADGEQVAKAIQQAADALEGIDVYLHTLTFDDFIPFPLMSHQEYREVRRINLDAAFHWGQKMGRKMAELGGGVMLYFMSDGCVTQYPEEVARCATHWTLKGLIRSMAVSLGPKGISVNAICPGVMDIPEEDAKREKMAAVLGVTPENLLEQQKSRSLQGRLQTLEEVAELSAFLLDEAINISGQALLLNGGASFN